MQNLQLFFLQKQGVIDISKVRWECYTLFNCYVL